jgi:1,2-diacylglycerol 3-alpha-glucosyltransferase
MKIGIVTTWAECGAGYVSLAYAEGLSRLGCEVAIYSRGQYLREQRWAPSEERPWPLEQDRCVDGLTRVSSRQFDRWLHHVSPDWLIFNEQRAWAPVLQARELGFKCAAYIDYYRSDTIGLFDLYDLLLCHTERHFEVFASNPRARFVPWGVDISKFSPGPRQATYLGSNSALVIVHSAGMGGPSDRKGTDIALQAFQATKGDARLLLHTQLPESQWPLAWKKAIEADQRIIVSTGRLEPVDFYRSGDLYLYPSRLEGIGLTLPEALSCGLSAITTDVPPMSEFVKTDVDGCLVPVKKFLGRSDGYYWPEAWVDVVTLTHCLQRYIDQPNLARSQGKNARLQMLQSRDWNTQVQHIYSCLEREGKRRISLDHLSVLRRLAFYQDRMHEPTVCDALFLAMRAVFRSLHRRWIQRL